MHLQIMTVCQEDSVSYLALMHTFILQADFSEAHGLFFLIDKKIGVNRKCCHADVPEETGQRLI